MEEQTTANIPLSNREVLTVLSARKIPSKECLEMIEYLKTVTKGLDKYPLELLRSCATSSSAIDPIKLCIVSNIQDLSILSTAEQDSDKALLDASVNLLMRDVHEFFCSY